MIDHDDCGEGKMMDGLYEFIKGVARAEAKLAISNLKWAEDQRRQKVMAEAKPEPVAYKPATVQPKEGKLYFDDTNGVLIRRNGQWFDLEQDCPYSHVTGTLRQANHSDIVNECEQYPGIVASFLCQHFGVYE